MFQALVKTSPFIGVAVVGAAEFAGGSTGEFAGGLFASFVAVSSCFATLIMKNSRVRS